MPSVHIVYASTSGNTEYVVFEVAKELEKLLPGGVKCQRAEAAGPGDFAKGDVLLLRSGTWNTGGREGQLNPVMDSLLNGRAAQVDLTGRKVSFISLGDERYYYRTRCTEHFLRFLRERGGTLFLPPLVLVNEPYGQEEKIVAWAGKLARKLDGA